ncbi:MAG: hypothetical protein AB8E15_13235 [Bdellovibrionales bacterium]
MRNSKTIYIDQHEYTADHILLRYSLGESNFHVRYKYEDICLISLEKVIGKKAMDRIVFHMSLFEANKLTSLAADNIDPGIYQEFVSPELAELWNICTKNIWAQWRFQNNKPNFNHAELSGSGKSLEPIKYKKKNSDYLLFCGGGKDSLLMCCLLSEQNIDFDILGYSIDFYGDQEKQKEYIKNVASVSKKAGYLHISVNDNLMSMTKEELSQFNCKELIGGETPSSLFSAIPYVILNQKTGMVLGNERSANYPNLKWDKEQGNEINHQWGKSFEAEKLLSNYINDYLLADCRYFSLLKPMMDPLIFKFLKKYQAYIGLAHSCNVEKPWCKKCPKCAYVYLNYMAYFDEDNVVKIFGGTSLFDLDENQKFFYDMLGLGEHTPFECIGQEEETILAFYLCAKKGIKGRAIDLFENNFTNYSPGPLNKNLFQLHNEHLIPKDLFLKLQEQFFSLDLPDYD